MNLNKLARWASVAAFSVIVPTAAMAKAHHKRFTPTTAPSSLTAKHVKTSAGKKSVVSKLSTRGTKAKGLKTTKGKATALKSKKVTSTKLVGKKHTVSKLTSKKTVASKLRTSKSKAHMLSSHKLASHKLTAKKAIKPATPVTPTM